MRDCALEDLVWHLVVVEEGVLCEAILTADSFHLASHPGLGF